MRCTDLVRALARPGLTGREPGARRHFGSLAQKLQNASQSHLVQSNQFWENGQ